MAPEQKKRIVIATKTLLDGRGHVLPETRIVVEGSKIVALDPKASPIDYDLRGFTVRTAHPMAASRLTRPSCSWSISSRSTDVLRNN
jgi:hypothetical protein